MLTYALCPVKFKLNTLNYKPVFCRCRPRVIAMLSAFSRRYLFSLVTWLTRAYREPNHANPHRGNRDAVLYTAGLGFDSKGINTTRGSHNQINTFTKEQLTTHQTTELQRQGGILRGGTQCQTALTLLLHTQTHTQTQSMTGGFCNQSEAPKPLLKKALALLFTCQLVSSRCL